MFYSSKYLLVMLGACIRQLVCFFYPLRSCHDTDRQTDRQTDRPTDRQTEWFRFTHFVILPEHQPAFIPDQAVLCSDFPGQPGGKHRDFLPREPMGSPRVSPASLFIPAGVLHRARVLETPPVWARCQVKGITASTGSTALSKPKATRPAPRRATDSTRCYTCIPEVAQSSDSTVVSGKSVNGRTAQDCTCQTSAHATQTSLWTYTVDRRLWWQMSRAGASRVTRCPAENRLRCLCFGSPHLPFSRETNAGSHLS